MLLDQIRAVNKSRLVKKLGSIDKNTQIELCNAFSSGSACKSGYPEPTHVLMAMDRTKKEAHCAVRFSLDTSATEEGIETTLLELKNVLLEIETTGRFLPCK